MLPVEGSDPCAAPPGLAGVPHLGCTALPSILVPGDRDAGGKWDHTTPAVDLWDGQTPRLQGNHRLGEQTANPTTEMGFLCASRSWLLLEAMRQDKGAGVPGWGQCFGPDCQLCKCTSIFIANGACKRLVQGMAVT